MRRYAFHTPAKLYYVLHFCNGGDLYYLLSRCKKFKESQARSPRDCDLGVSRSRSRRREIAISRAQARFYAGEVFLAISHLHELGVRYL